VAVFAHQSEDGLRGETQLIADRDPETAVADVKPYSAVDRFGASCSGIYWGIIVQKALRSAFGKRWRGNAS
jgi:hypothetical protein